MAAVSTFGGAGSGVGSGFGASTGTGSGLGSGVGAAFSVLVLFDTGFVSFSAGLLS